MSCNKKIKDVWVEIPVNNLREGDVIRIIQAGEKQPLYGTDKLSCRIKDGKVETSTNPSEGVLPELFFRKDDRIFALRKSVFMNVVDDGIDDGKPLPDARSESLSALRALIADDCWAITFQSLGQYRAALLLEIDKHNADHEEKT